MSKGKRGNPAWQPGVSGNPSGRIKNPITDIIRSKTGLPEQIVDALVPLLTSRSWKCRVAVAEFLADRGWGKPAQTTELTGAEGSRLIVELGPGVK